MPDYSAELFGSGGEPDMSRDRAERMLKAVGLPPLEQILGRTFEFRCTSDSAYTPSIFRGVVGSIQVFAFSDEELRGNVIISAATPFHCGAFSTVVAFEAGCGSEGDPTEWVIVTQPQDYGRKFQRRGRIVLVEPR